MDFYTIKHIFEFIEPHYTIVQVGANEFELVPANTDFIRTCREFYYTWLSMHNEFIPRQHTDYLVEKALDFDIKLLAERWENECYPENPKRFFTFLRLALQDDNDDHVYKICVWMSRCLSGDVNHILKWLSNTEFGSTSELFERFFGVISQEFYDDRVPEFTDELLLSLSYFPDQIWSYLELEVHELMLMFELTPFKVDMAKSILDLPTSGPYDVDMSELDEGKSRNTLVECMIDAGRVEEIRYVKAKDLYVYWLNGGNRLTIKEMIKLIKDRDLRESSVPFCLDALEDGSCQTELDELLEGNEFTLYDLVHILACHKCPFDRMKNIFAVYGFSFDGLDEGRIMEAFTMADNDEIPFLDRLSPNEFTSDANIIRCFRLAMRGKFHYVIDKLAPLINFTENPYLILECDDAYTAEIMIYRNPTMLPYLIRFDILDSLGSTGRNIVRNPSYPFRELYMRWKYERQQ